MAASETAGLAAPRQVDLDRCVHCGLCLNACPTYRELGLEMDSPRGRIYQMVRVSEGALPIAASYIAHIDLCLACRSCESACPSGVPYGRLIEDARAAIERCRRRPWWARASRRFLLGPLLENRRLLATAGVFLYLYEVSGLRRLAESRGVASLTGKLGRLAKLAPSADAPFFFSHIGQVFPAEGERRHRVAFLTGCIANVCFARLNEATVRVLRKNGCEVAIPEGQTCCGALHVHSGLREEARRLARKNIDALEKVDCEAIITNAAGCGSTLKEYPELLADDAAYAEPARRFAARLKDVTEFLASIDLNRSLGQVECTATYQDSCHLAHGQKIRIPPRKLLAAVPGLKFRELPLAEICCGSAGVYNVLQDEMAAALLQKKMQQVNATGADTIVTANPGCLLQLRAGVKLHGRGQRVVHVVEVLDEAYRNWRPED